jgi:hypothetical protein
MQINPKVQDVVAAAIPFNATVYVVSPDDDDLLITDGKRVRKFPRPTDGLKPGTYPKTSAAAVGFLEKILALKPELSKAGRYLFFPATAFWWFHRYPEFRAYLDAHFHRIWSDERSVVYQLWEGPRLRFTSTPSPMTQAAREAGPVAIGGLDREAAGVLAAMLMELDYFLGSELNTANDNLLLGYLLRGLPTGGGKLRGEMARGLSILGKIMTGDAGLTPEETDFFTSRAAEWVDSPEDAGALVERVVYQAQHLDYASYRGWAWKAPVGPQLHPAWKEVFPGLKYIHVMRHGLDTAFSTDADQVRRWCELSGTPVPEKPEQLPRAALAHWIQVNERMQDLGKKLLGDRFLAVPYDDWCQDPRRGVSRLIEFLGVAGKMGVVERLSGLVSQPENLGVYRQKNLSIFTPDELAAVRKLGFAAEAR